MSPGMKSGSKIIEVRAGEFTGEAIFICEDGRKWITDPTPAFVIEVPLSGMTRGRRVGDRIEEIPE